jgi:hypothetical protein
LYFIETDWQKDIQRNTAETTPVFLVGNKCDLEGTRKITAQQAEEFATTNKMKYFETRAKMAVNVTKAFEELTKEMLGPAAGYVLCVLCVCVCVSCETNDSNREAKVLTIITLLFFFFKNRSRKKTKKDEGGRCSLV